MTKNEFLTVLTECLEGNVPMEIIDENIRYYRDYIENGKASEKEALEDLGDPHLIARTIIDSFKASKGPMADYYTEQARSEYSQSSGAGQNYADKDNSEEYSRGLKWYEKILLAGIILVVLAACVVIGSVAISIFIRIVLPLIVVFLAIRFAMDYFRRG